MANAHSLRAFPKIPKQSEILGRCSIARYVPKPWTNYLAAETAFTIVGKAYLSERGVGFCVKHDSVLFKPERTTCKYLHRQDLPRFVVDEGLREHAGEFARFSGMADLYLHDSISRLAYSEKFVWERKQFDPINQSLAQYHKVKPAWTFLQAMSGELDGRRSLTHASLVRRYMDNCGTWRSSYRFLLALLQELSSTPQFQDGDLNSEGGEITVEFKAEAVWDVFFARLGGVQEYGFHSGLETLMWSTDELNGSLVSLDWPGLHAELEIKIPEWTELIIKQATDEGEFFAQQSPTDNESEREVY